MDVATTTLLQRIVPSDLLGRVFGGLYGGIGVAAALAYLSGGLLLDLTTPRVAFLTAGTCGLLATLATAVATGTPPQGTSRTPTRLAEATAATSNVGPVGGVRHRGVTAQGQWQEVDEQRAP